MALSRQQSKTLRKRLAELYPDTDESKLVVDEAGIPRGNIAFNNSSKLNWHSIIEEGGKRNMICDLIDAALSDYEGDQVLMQLKNELCSTAPITSPSAVPATPSYTVGNNPAPEVNNPPPVQLDPRTETDIRLSNLKSLIATGKLGEAIEILLKTVASVSNDIENQVVLTSARYRSLLKNQQMGLITYQNASITENQIRYSLTALIDELKDELNQQHKISHFNQNTDQELSETKIRELYSKKKVLMPQTDEEVERIIGKRPNLVKKSWLLKGLKASDCVGRIHTQGYGYHGTGFLLKGGHIMTNQHVLMDQDMLADSFIEFNFTDENGNNKDVYRYEFDKNFYHSRPYIGGGIPKENGYDYALAKVIDNGKVPLGNLGFLSFETLIQPEEGEPVNIIQHPGGSVQQFALTANEVIGNWEHYLFYKADTQKGSSGSPVFNQDWNVIALHHAGQNETDASGGLKINAAGDIQPANRGILIRYILDDLETQGITF